MTRCDLSGIGLVNFAGAAVVSLHDEDWPDSDDFLGEWRINENEAQTGVRIATFTGDDAHYTMRYQVGRAMF